MTHAIVLLDVDRFPDNLNELGINRQPKAALLLRRKLACSEDPKVCDFQLSLLDFEQNDQLTFSERCHPRNPLSPYEMTFVVSDPSICDQAMERGVIHIKFLARFDQQIEQAKNIHDMAVYKMDYLEQVFTGKLGFKTLLQQNDANEPLAILALGIEGLALRKFNDEQQDVLRIFIKCLAEKKRLIIVVRGPPGTGKTYLNSIIASAGVENHRKVLLIGPSNASVDVLIEALGPIIRDRFLLVRLGNYEKTKEELRHYHIDEQAKHYEVLSKIACQRRWAEQLRTDPNAHCRRWETPTHKEITDMAHVIACTLNSIPSVLAKRKHTYGVTIIDEASQAIEPETLHALTYSSGVVFLIGDNYQLPPTIFAHQADECCLPKSLFVCLLEENGIANVIELTKQYRMHPNICQIAAKAIEGNNITSARSADDFEETELSYQVVFVNVAGGKAIRNERTLSFSNNEESVNIRLSLELFIKKHKGRNFKIAVLTFYEDQGKLIAEELKESSEEVVRNIAVINEVKNVDGSQGGEYDIVFLSCCRTSDLPVAGFEDEDKRKCPIGFLQFSNRVNVALTRPRLGLVIFFDKKAFENAPVWG